MYQQVSTSSRPPLSQDRPAAAEVAAACQVLAGLVAEPWGQVSPSVYETGRLVVLAPWLAGHADRVEFLLRTQRPDGAWGGPDGYAVVPTLSATDALLDLLAAAQPAAERARLVPATDRGLRALAGPLLGLRAAACGTPQSGPLQPGPAAGRPVSIPDTPAIEIIMPALVASVNDRLARLRDEPGTGLPDWWGAVRLPLPAGLDSGPVTAVRQRLAGGGAVPDKLLHSLEIAGPAAGSGAVRTAGPGTVGASPAATAAWLAGHPASGRDPAAVGYLEAVAARHGGPVPSVIPITMFERAWVLSSLGTAGVPVTVPVGLLAGLREGLSAAGTPGGAGLPPDADSTAGVLYALARHGMPVDVDCLWAYETDTHFCAWHGERTASATVNAHVLEAFGSQSHDQQPHRTARYRAAVAKISDWLCGQQRPDGSWTDKWHASAYYATVCCVLALHRFGRARHGGERARHGGDQVHRDGERITTAVQAATRWVLSTQHADGSWGRWGGTAEETAYALQVLLLGPAATDERAVRAAARGYAHLRRTAGRSEHPALWHDKDLYLPAAVVRAAILAALHLARHNRAVAGLAAGMLSESAPELRHPMIP